MSGCVAVWCTDVKQSCPSAPHRLAAFLLPGGRAAPEYSRLSGQAGKGWLPGRPAAFLSYLTTTRQHHKY